MATPALCPEMRLLLAACHVGAAPPAAPDGACDPAILVRLAAYHRVSGLVYRAREAVPLPAEAIEPLRAATLATLHRNLQNAAELKPALRALACAEVPVILLKGVHLMDAVYGDPALRPLSDMDLLVRASDLTAAMEVLAPLGYGADARKARFGLAADREVRLARSGVHEVVLDLHTDLNRPTRHHWFDTEAMWSRSEPVTFEGEPARALCPADSLTFLCAHAVPHAFGQLIWLCDIAWLLRARTVEASALVEIAGATRTRRAVWAGLHMAESLLGAAVDPGILSMLDPDGRLRAGLSSRLDPAIVFRGGYSTAASLRFRAALSDTRRDAAEVLAASVRRKAGALRRGLADRRARGRGSRG